MSQFHYVDFAMVLLIANYQLYYMLIANSWTQSGILRSRLTGCPEVPFMLPLGQRCDAGNSDSQQNGSLGGRGGSFPDTWPQLASLRTTTRTTSKSSDTVIKCVFNDTWVPSCVCSGNNRYSAPWPQPPSAQNVDCTADGVEPLRWAEAFVESSHYFKLRDLCFEELVEIASNPKICETVLKSDLVQRKTKRQKEVLTSRLDSLERCSPMTIEF